ncbi:unnamed protein product [Mytilus edulis]|uniref:Uncharacterized protein n=1 Tax=Mytilus edulis TaxID=6550 RepID=A0A8S3TQC5_MYTED|nr:unnamed protein product [Mytilus edulis]
MDLSTIVGEKLLGFTPRKAVRLFLTRMWIGYAFDAGEFAFLWIHVGMMWISDLWKIIFYAYVGFLGFVALLITILMICLVLSGPVTDGRLNRYKKIPYIMGYFKLTATVNAAIVFFMLFFSTEKDEPVVLALEIVAGIDIGLNLFEMAFGFAGFNLERLCAKEQIHSIQDTPDPIPPISTSRRNRKK